MQRLNNAKLYFNMFFKPFTLWIPLKITWNLHFLTSFSHSVFFWAVWNIRNNLSNMDSVYVHSSSLALIIASHRCLSSTTTALLTFAGWTRHSKERNKWIHWGCKPGVGWHYFLRTEQLSLHCYQMRLFINRRCWNAVSDIKRGLFNPSLFLAWVFNQNTLNFLRRCNWYI